MIRYLFRPFLALSFFIAIITACAHIRPHDDYLLSFTDESTDQYGYRDAKGRAVISLGKYTMCFTDTFRTYAIVLKEHSGFVAIDRQENVLYNVFPFDNGPDYVEDGLFRIIEDRKIGFADAKTGIVIIKPQFDCAFPFENGKAKVSTDCKSEFRGEHKIWISENWFYIDKSGRNIDQP
ncbi:WG repeat-containing protein [bacterium]|nr:WG repeat-containing protein [bacterium]